MKFWYLFFELLAKYQGLKHELKMIGLKFKSELSMLEQDHKLLCQKQYEFYRKSLEIKDNK